MRRLGCVFGAVAALALAAAAAQAGWSIGWDSCGCAARSPYAAPACMSPTYGYYAPGCCPCVAPSCCDHIWDGYCFERRCCRVRSCESVGVATSVGCSEQATGVVNGGSAGVPTEPAPKPAPALK